MAWGRQPCFSKIGDNEREFIHVVVPVPTSLCLNCSVSFLALL